MSIKYYVIKFLGFDNVSVTWDKLRHGNLLMLISKLYLADDQSLILVIGQVQRSNIFTHKFRNIFIYNIAKFLSIPQSYLKIRHIKKPNPTWLRSCLFCNYFSSFSDFVCIPYVEILSFFVLTMTSVMFLTGNFRVFINKKN